MKTSSIEAILRALNGANVRYVIAGGLAVVAHGYVRFTADMDLMVALDHDNLVLVIRELQVLGYRPRAPVAMEAVLDAALREQWIREKGLKVFSLYSSAHPGTEIDLFLEMPLNFEVVYARSVQRELLPGVQARFCSLEDLVTMKLQAARPRDLEDVRNLRRIQEDGNA